MATTPRARQAMAAWCKEYRAHTGETQAQLAAVLEVHRSTVVRYETVKLYPSRDVRIHLNELARESGFRPIPPPR